MQVFLVLLAVFIIFVALLWLLVPAWYGLPPVTTNRERIRKALELVNEPTCRPWHRAVLLHALGVAHAKKEEFIDAVASFRESLHIKQSDGASLESQMRTRMQLAWSLLNASDYSAVESETTILESQLALLPTERTKRDELLWLRGWLHIHTRNPSGSLRAWTDLIARLAEDEPLFVDTLSSLNLMEDALRELSSVHADELALLMQPLRAKLSEAGPQP